MFNYLKTIKKMFNYLKKNYDMHVVKLCNKLIMTQCKITKKSLCIYCSEKIESYLYCLKEFIIVSKNV